ncbi:succinate dehydrogenase cytochrome b subunit [Blattabacterium cuenoti]|uniref:succinate dehydrogenase cytochrome b subunit n=1 Tax=Blattabacterium cuenoti TaxID=1653831 RepID=UPI001EEA78B2|nr:succinate dehydrogenase cytochrome b subunit [Blattabacterium cuenoti]
MNISYLNIFQSSIGKKIIMAFTGIFLMIFLLLHLSVNLFLFLGESAFNNAVFFMKKNIIIRIMEYFLASGFIIHIFMGIKLSVQNKISKGNQRYMNFFSIINALINRKMIITGILILCFIILHLINFSFPMKYSSNNYISDYYIVTSLFKNPFYTFIYIFSFIILGIHLNHGFQSVFQTLGLSSKKSIVWIKLLGYFYLWFICSGFSLIAIWFFFN